MPATISRADYAAMFGPTVGDRVRLADPELIIEVLSPTTEDQDRGRKLFHYRSIPSLQVILLVALEGMSYGEVAETVGVAQGTVMSRLSRGRERLRRLVDEGAPELRVVK